MLKALKLSRNFWCVSQRVHTSSFVQTKDEPKKNAKRKVKETVELITLVSADDKIMGLKPKSESEKLANKLNLILQKVEDSRFGKSYPAYKLVSAADVFSGSGEEKTSTQKALKKLPLNSKIEDHDLTIKIKTIRKWLTKNCEIHIAVAGNNDSEQIRKNVLKKIEEQLKGECRIIDIRVREEALKFIIVPPKKEKTSTAPTGKSSSVSPNKESSSVSPNKESSSVSPNKESSSISPSDEHSEENK